MAVLLALLLPDATLAQGDESYFEFADGMWGDPVTSATVFMNSGGGSMLLAPYGDLTSQYAGITFASDERNGTALAIAQGVNVGVSLASNAPVAWGTQFTVEARFKTEGAFHNHDVDIITAETGDPIYPFLWLKFGGGTVQWSLSDYNSGIFYWTGAFLPRTYANEWVNIVWTLNLQAVEEADVCKLWVNGSSMTTVPAYDAWPTSLPISSDNAKFFVRSSDQVNLTVDYLRISPGILSPAEFLDGNGSGSWDPPNSSVIALDSTAVLQRLKNSATELAAGATPVSDVHPNPVGEFHGMFQISCVLDPMLVEEGYRFDVLLQKPGDVFKKIGEAVVPAKPAAGRWTAACIWNSRSPAFEWTPQDAEAFHTDEAVRLRFELR